MQPVDYPYDSSDPFGHIRPSGKAHTGSDWLCPTGTVVRAVLPGAIVATGWNDGNGFYVAQSLPDGRFWSYIHLSQIDVTVGQSVDEGTRVALSGNTGKNSLGPHLHCSLSTSESVFLGTPVLSDPYAFLTAQPPAPPPVPKRKKKKMNMAAVKGEQRVWAVWSPGFYFEIKDAPGLSVAEVNDQVNFWNAQNVNGANFVITRKQANELRAMCLAK
jgi:murein DD-endopeptidase MepM/ murein hydrolase activator NlpD